MFQSFLESPEAKFPAYALDDGVGIHFIDGNLTGVYTTSAAGRLLICSVEQENIKENDIRPESIGSVLDQVAT